MSEPLTYTQHVMLEYSEYPMLEYMADTLALEYGIVLTHAESRLKPNREISAIIWKYAIRRAAARDYRQGLSYYDSDM